MLETILMYIRLIFYIPIFILLLLISLLIPSTVDTDIGQYETYRQELNYAVDFMPSLDALGEYEELHFGYQETSQFIFCPKTMSLTAQYDAAEYEVVKQQMLNSYNSLDEPVVDTDGDVLLDDFFMRNGYDFHGVPARAADTHSACKYFGLLGFNDDTCSIAWLYYDDVDRDYIATSDEDLDQKMHSLIDDEFHWKPFTE